MLVIRLSVIFIRYRCKNTILGVNRLLLLKLFAVLLPNSPASKQKARSKLRKRDGNMTRRN